MKERTQGTAEAGNKKNQRKEKGIEVNQNIYTNKDNHLALSKGSL